MNAPATELTVPVASARNPGRVVVPVVFLDEVPFKQILISEAGALKVCDLHTRSPRAARQAFLRLRQKLNIHVFPGHLFSYEELQRKTREHTLVKQLSRRTADRGTRSADNGR